MIRRLILPVMLLAFVSACSDDIETAPAGAPKSREDAQRESRGKITGEGGLLAIGGKDKNEGGILGVNSYLWRATLDTLSFMPLTSADPFGGTIITDWYEDPKTPGERYKVNAIILDKTLRADGIKITMFKQRKSGGGWRDLGVDPKITRALEDTILTRARELKISAGN